MDGWVNVDWVDQDGVDVVHDLDVYPWPWGDSSVSEIRAWDIFEHVDYPLEFISECWRILEPGGVLFLHTSYWKTYNSFTDPTHKRFCTEDTFRYWTPGTHRYDRYRVAYSRGQLQDQLRKDDTAGFGELKVMRDGQELSVWLAKIPLNAHYALGDDVVMPWDAAPWEVPDADSAPAG